MRKYFVANEEDGLDLYTMAFFIDNWPKVANRYLKNKIDFITVVSNNHVKWCPDRKRYLAGGKEVLSWIVKSPSTAARFKKQVVKIADQLTRSADGMAKLKLEGLSNRQLVSLAEEVYDTGLEMVGLGMLFTALELSNDLLTDHLRELLDKKISKIKPRRNLAEYFNILTDEPFRGVGDQELRDRLKIASKLNSSGNWKALLRTDAKLKSTLKKHTEKYFWMSYNYQGPVLPFSHFSKQLAETLASGDFKTELRKLGSHDKTVVSDRHQAEKELKLSNYEKELFAAARDCVYLKTYRRDALVYALARLDTVFREMAKRTGYSFAQIRHCLPWELNLLFGKKNVGKLLDDRIKLSAYFWENGKPKVLTGVKARQFEKENIEEDEITNVTQLQGTTAFPGKVTGRVKIINKPEEITKMKKGDILVSILTIPQIVPAMKLAAAIVTDIGGITSHAAIISRELKKPCVIGTRIGTKVLRDGDLVEVDAYKGVVRKL